MRTVLRQSIGVIAILTISIVPIFAGESQRPVIKQFEVDEYNNVIQPYGPVDEKRSEIVVENVDHLRLECHANYPVQWVYTGNGVPIINTDVSRSSVYTETESGSGQLERFEYVASVFLGPLREHHTGKYQCSRTDIMTVVPNLYVYVPGKDLFTLTEGKTIYINPNVSSVSIPCSVTHPKVKVSLYKREGGKLRVPTKKSDDAIVFDPRKGFRLRLKQLEDPEGTYLCTGNFNDLNRDVEYRIISDNPYDLQSDAPANFEEARQRPQERCIGDQCKQCDTHSDCPSGMHCYTDLKCRDPCEYSIRCGKGSKCRLVDDRPRCFCPSGYVGDPTKECFNRP